MAEISLNSRRQTMAVGGFPKIFRDTLHACDKFFGSIGAVMNSPSIGIQIRLAALALSVTSRETVLPVDRFSIPKRSFNGFRGYTQYDTVSSSVSVTQACVRARYLKQPRDDDGGTAAKYSAELKRTGELNFALLISRTKMPRRGTTRHPSAWRVRAAVDQWKDTTRRMVPVRWFVNPRFIRSNWQRLPLLPAVCPLWKISRTRRPAGRRLLLLLLRQSIDGCSGWLYAPHARLATRNGASFGNTTRWILKLIRLATENLGTWDTVLNWILGGVSFADRSREYLPSGVNNSWQSSVSIFEMDTYVRRNIIANISEFRYTYIRKTIVTRIRISEHMRFYSNIFISSVLFFMWQQIAP